MSSFINYNGKLLPSDEPIISADNRGLRYGEGLFETMRMVNERIPLWDFHEERLFNGLQQLQFELPGSFSREFILKEIKKLCNKNSTTKSSRVRLGVFRGNGALYDLADNRPNFIIQSWEIEPFAEKMNSNGLVIDTYPDARKSCDPFANLKSNNFLPYTMGAIFARQNNLHDCLILNSNERICDSTTANIFVRRGKIYKTPPLSEGCIAGVMRRWLIESDPSGKQFKEEPVTVEDLLEADEIFLSNAVQGIRWVKQFRNKTYMRPMSAMLYFGLRAILFKA